MTILAETTMISEIMMNYKRRSSTFSAVSIPPPADYPPLSCDWERTFPDARIAWLGKPTFVHIYLLVGYYNAVQLDGT
jgi:hypothetical protein